LSDAEARNQEVLLKAAAEECSKDNFIGESKSHEKLKGD